MNDATLITLLQKISNQFDGCDLELNGKSYSIEDVCDAAIAKIHELNIVSNELKRYCEGCGFNIP